MLKHLQPSSVFHFVSICGYLFYEWWKCWNKPNKLHWAKLTSGTQQRNIIITERIHHTHRRAGHHLSSPYLQTHSTSSMWTFAVSLVIAGECSCKTYVMGVMVNLKSFLEWEQIIGCQHSFIIISFAWMPYSGESLNIRRTVPSAGSQKISVCQCEYLS